MNNLAKELLESISAQAEWELSLVTKESLKDLKQPLSSYKRQMAESAINEKKFSIDAINFSGNSPFVYFKFLKDFDVEQIRDLHRKIWNEGRAPLLGIITPQEIRLYDCFDIPNPLQEDLVKNQRGKTYKNTKSDIQELAELLHQSKIDSGTIWENSLGTAIKTKNRVDRKLVENLAIAREKLHTKFKMPFSIVHDLLGRSLFTLYLQDRGILNPENYPQKKTVFDFFELLEYPKATIELFDYLKQKFNGDLFPVTDQERSFIEKNPEALLLVKDCFLGNDLLTKQLSFNWRIFQFQYIPIELISSIYEEFMSVEDEEHEGFKKEQKKKNDGAFYTPPMLVEFVLNEVLPYPDENNKRYDLKILDPACGSGIFLVESYKRLIARWKFSNNKPEISEEVLEELLLNNIFGIEYDPEAIKVAAFSLYLTYLDYIKPTKVLNKDARFIPLINWQDKNKKGNIKQGSNLFQFNTFSKDLSVFKNDIDLVIGNPPWLRGKAKNEVLEYIDKQNIPKDIVCAYLHFIPEVTPNATIALVSKAKVLFNTEEISQRFRQHLFEKNNIEAVINLSVVRDVIFENATAPAAVLIYQKRKLGKPRKDYVIYCVPKSEAVIRNRRTIVIDASEVKFIPLTEILKKNSKAFKIAMWGNVRDSILIDKLNKFQTIQDRILTTEHGMGLIKDKSAKKKGNPHLESHYFLLTSEIQPYYTNKKGKLKIGDQHKVYRTDQRNLYSPPLVLFKEGTNSDSVCSSFIDFKCVFQSSSLGIKIKNRNENFHKALVACFNSALANYYFFLTSASWEVNKGGQIQKNEALEFPAFVFDMDEQTINNLASLVDKIVMIAESNDLEPFRDKKIVDIQKQIDKIIFADLNLFPNEIALISDVLNFSVSLNSRYKESNAESFIRADKELMHYAKIVAKTITSSLKNKKKGAWVEVVDTGNIREPIHIIAIHFDNQEEFGSAKGTTVNNISKLLHQINNDTYQKHSETIYYRKLIKYYKNGVIYLVKPNQKRFWTISQALNDADNIVLDLLTQ